ncbi:OmpA family protein [Hymenobacter gummosus]|uniref:OmpA family protein n=1 Tax=Hymenobacter gummosus TaxID=1776032 RepID=A0A431U5G7_9BACT|nr:OmpA family protein [Hymenobacter gummosus]RTQ50882.1 OmpA family protein [Hymenobacter gummosus]
MKHHLPSLLLPLVLLTTLPRTGTAQNADRRTGVSLNLNVLQYKGDFGSEYWDFSHNNYAPGLAINQYLGRGLDLHAQLLYGTLSGRRSAATYFNTDVVNVNLGLKLKLNNGWALKEKSFLQPYLLVAPGWTFVNRAGYYNGERIDLNKGYFDLFGGAGLGFRLGGGVSLFVQSAQHLPLDADFDGETKAGAKRWNDQFMQHTVGLTFNLGQAADEDQDEVPDRKDRCPGTAPGTPVDEYGCPLDADHDGVPDAQDQCPGDAGTAELHGCPDRDNDGLADPDDACPEVAGKPELQGCPDADNDGVPDREDKCPDTPTDTHVDADGCPVADAPATPAQPAAPAPAPTPATPGDADNDGVPDAADRCPNAAGPASNKGCPEVKAETRQRLREATRFISFEPNKATLLPSSYPTLDGIAQILRDYPDYTLSIAGHTDSKGPAAFNQRLSRERAAAARAYLVGPGISESRLQLRGYGPAHPIAPNTTEAGRARNRRVEFDLYLTGDRNAAEVKYGKEPGAAPVKPKAPAKKAPVRKPAARNAAVKKPAAAVRKAPVRPTAKPAPTKPAAPAKKAPARQPAQTTPAPPRR